MEELIVEIEQGKLRGKTALDYKGEKYYSFQGIPYAKQPVGERRFQIAQPPDRWQGIRDCRQESSESLSNHPIYEFKVGSEYCLNLNVYTPKLPNEDEPSNLLPVMFWIHGGAWVTGSSKTEFFGPEYLMTGNVILVTVNYRLGILGFLSLEDETLNVPGNNGLKDLVHALNWVQKNIHIFNGDAKNVTIFGNSCGSAAIQLLMTSNMAEGLFHKGIMQSGSVQNPWAVGSRCAKTIAKAVNIESTNEGDILDAVMSISEDQILEAQNKIPDNPAALERTRAYGYVVEKPCKEPNLITREPLEILDSGDYPKIPLMIGYTDREGMFSEVKQRLVTGGFKFFTDFETKIPEYYGIPKGSELSKQIAKRIKEFYFKNSNPSLENIDDYYLLETDNLGYRGIYITLKMILKHSNCPTYFYRFSADLELNWSKKFGKITSPGASHMDELGYLFKTTFLPVFPKGSKEDILIQRMVRLWTNFAKNGNPNPVDDDEDNGLIWKPAKEGEHHFLDINETLTVGVNPDQERMDFWDEIDQIIPSNKNL